MKTPFKAILIVVNFFVIIAIVNGEIFKKQAILNSGRTVFLKLAPVDPRSLIQGDYMVLNYAINDDHNLRNGNANIPTRGKMILKLDRNSVGTFSHISEGDFLLEKNEVILNFRKWRGGFRFGIESFFFQEGQAQQYETAKYAELQISINGDPVIVDLVTTPESKALTP